MSYTKPEKASQSDGKPPSDVGSAAATNTSQGSFTLFDSSRKGDASAALFIPLAITPTTEKEEYPGDRDLDPLLRPKFRRFPSVAYADPDTESHFVMYLFGDAFASTSVIGYICVPFFAIAAFVYSGFPGESGSSFVVLVAIGMTVSLFMIATINLAIVWRHRKAQSTWHWERRKSFFRTAERLVVALVFTLPLVVLSGFPSEKQLPIQARSIYPFLTTSCLASLLVIRVRAQFSIPIVLFMAILYHLTIPFSPPLKRMRGNMVAHTVMQVLVIIIICLSLAGLEVLRRASFELFVRRRRAGTAKKQHEQRIQKTLTTLLPGDCVQKIIQGTSIIEDRPLCGIAVSRLQDNAFCSLQHEAQYGAIASNALFSTMDESIFTFNCEKVKVLGDCYIASCGLRTAVVAGGAAKIGSSGDQDVGGAATPPTSNLLSAEATIARNLFQFVSYQLRIAKRLASADRQVAYVLGNYVVGVAIGSVTGAFFGSKSLSYNIDGEAFRTAWTLSRTSVDVHTSRLTGPPDVAGTAAAHRRSSTLVKARHEAVAWTTPQAFVVLPEKVQTKFRVYEGVHPVRGGRVFRLKPGRGVVLPSGQQNNTAVGAVTSSSGEVSEEQQQEPEVANPLGGDQIDVEIPDDDLNDTEDIHHATTEEDAAAVAERTSFLHQIARKSAMEWATEDQRAILESTSQGPEAQSPLDVAKTALNRGDRHWLLNVVHPKFEPTAEAQFWKWCDGEVITGRAVDLGAAIIFTSAIALGLAAEKTATLTSLLSLLLAYLLVGTRILLLHKIDRSWWFLDFHAVTLFAIFIAVAVIASGPGESVLKGDLFYLPAVLSINYLFGSSKVRWGWTSLCMCLLYPIAYYFSSLRGHPAWMTPPFVAPLGMAIVCYAARVREGLRRQGFGNYYLESALQAMFEFDLLLHRSLLHMIVPPYISNLVAAREAPKAGDCLKHWIEDAVLLRMRFATVSPTDMPRGVTADDNASNTNLTNSIRTSSRDVGSLVLAAMIRNFKAVEAAMEAVNCTDLLSVVAIVGDELVVGGPLLLPDKTDSPALYASAVIIDQFQRLRHFGTEDGGKSAALLLRLVKDILTRFKPREVTAVMSCQLGFAVVLGVVQPSFNILGPVARISSVLMDAAPPGYVGMTEAFASAAARWKRSSQPPLGDDDEGEHEEVQPEQHSETWSLRGAGRIRMFPLSETREK